MKRNAIQLAFPAEYRFLAILNQAIVVVTEMLRDEGTINEAEVLAGDVYLAAHEVCTNVIDHAYAPEEAEAIRVEIMVDSADKQLQVIVQDNGRSFDPQTLGWPPAESWQMYENCQGIYYQLGTVPEPSIEQERGRGLYLLTQLLEEVIYRPGRVHNCWQLRKKF